MEDSFVTKKEFENLKEDTIITKKALENLKEEVKEVKTDMIEDRKLLQSIDKKIDIINNKVTTSETVEDLKLKPLEKRVNKLEETQEWLRKTVITAILGLILEVVIFVIKMM